MFYVSSTAGRLRQGEILTDLIQAHLEVETLFSEKPNIARRSHPFAVILTQDCDLEQDWEARENLNTANQKPEALARLKARLLSSILFAEAVPAETLKQRIDFDKRVVERFEQNKDERYQFLSPITIDEDALKQGVPALGLDFKKYFTVPVDEVYARLKQGLPRRAVLTVPYAEHLSSRFFHFQSRIALENQHMESS